MIIHADTCGPALAGDSHPRVEPALRSLRSFLFNVRRLGFCWWLRLALVNALRSLRRRPPDP